jgi:hypothetical protein
LDEGRIQNCKFKVQKRGKIPNSEFRIFNTSHVVCGKAVGKLASDNCREISSGLQLFRAHLAEKKLSTPTSTVTSAEVVCSSFA